MPPRRNQAGVWLLFVVLTCVFLNGCVHKEAPGPTLIEVADQTGRMVRLRGVPERIVSLAPSNTEILFALGLGQKVVGVTSYDDFPPEVRQKEKVGGFSTPDMEKIVALAPDLVVAAPVHERRVVPEMEKRGLAALVLAPRTMEGIMQAITLTGEVTGEEETAKSLVKDIEGRLEAVKRLTLDMSVEDRPRVFFVLWHDPLQTVGKGTLTNELIEAAGGRNIFGDLDSYPNVDLELVLKRNPQVIVADSGHGSAKNLPLGWAKNEDRLNATDALLHSRVYGIDADLVNRPGPRAVEGLEQMLRLLHPGLGVKD